MELENNKSKLNGKGLLTKESFETVAKIVAILGGFISAVILILTLNNATKQRALELRWNQAKLAAELIDAIVHDPLAFNALNMIDWENKKYEIRNDTFMISSSDVLKALNVRNNLNLSAKEEFIRESFDRLSYHIGKIERSLESNLVKFDDVQSPMNYYVPFLHSKFGSVIIPYMKQLHHDDALKFMNRFEFQVSNNAGTGRRGM